MSRLDEYFAIPEDYGTWLGGLRWSADGEAIEHSAESPEIGLTFAMSGELALFLHGLHSTRPPMHFAYVLHLLRLIGAGGRLPDLGPGQARLEALASAFRQAGRPMRGAGVLCGMLARDVPRAVDPPNPEAIVGRLLLRRGQSPSPTLAELPSLEPEEFQKRILKRLNGLTDQDLRHWIVHGRGPVGEAGDEVARQAEARPRDLIETLDAASGAPGSPGPPRSSPILPGP